MSNTVSVSKGVFAFKRSSSNAAGQGNCKKHKSKKGTAVSSYWPTDDDCTSVEQQEHYQACWSVISDKLKRLESELHERVFKDLVTFIAGSNAHTSSAGKCAGLGSSIPTAILVTGVNMPDSAEILASLNEQVKQQQAASHIVRLHSRNCATLKCCIVSMVSQILNSRAGPTLSDVEDTSDDSEEDECRENKSPNNRRKRKKKSSTASIKKANCTMTALDAWQQERACSGNIVVIVEDVECFTSPQLLQDFIQICSHHPRLPLVLVLCVATSPAAIHSRLIKPVLACLAITTFQARPSHHYLTTLVDQVLMEGGCSSFRLGGKALKSLLDMFLYHHLSVNTFVQGFKFCALDHFLSTPQSLLCCLPTDRRRRLQRLTPHQLEQVRRLPSFRLHVDSVPTAQKRDLLLNDDKTKEVLLELLRELDEHYGLLCTVVRALHLVTAIIPNAPMGRQMWSVFSASMNSRVCELAEMEEVWQHVQGWSREELLTPLPAIITTLTASPYSQLHDHAAKLQQHMNDLLDMDEENMQNDNTLPENVTQFSPVKQLQPTDRFQLKEKLLELAKKKQSKPNRFQTIRLEIIKSLKDTVQEFLIPPTSWPLHEIMFYNNSSEVIDRVIGQHRAAITKALVDPCYYLQCTCCTGESLSSSLPDLSLVYRLHLECGRLINLYDWMQAFFAYNEDNNNEHKLDEDHAKVLQTRFVRAVSELQFLGFIKTSKSKTDHVARLTWGNF